MFVVDWRRDETVYIADERIIRVLAFGLIRGVPRAG
jgi:hypothetical protein